MSMPQAAHPTMTVLVSGASGLIGSALSAALLGAGHRVLRLVRPGAAGSAAGAEAVSWDPDAGRLDAAALEGVQAVVHLAGRNIAAGRWTARARREIRDSRVNSTLLLARAIAGARRRPGVFLCASAVGYYGHQGAEWLDEGSPAGAAPSFLAEVGQAWESACRPAAEAGVRVVNARLGVVLSPSGGALPRMLPLFRLGLGGRLGSGRQYWSWIALEDCVAALGHCLVNAEVTGPVNITAPEPVTNAQFTQTLARVLRRPAVLPVPAFALRLAMGRMADELLLASARVRPGKLLASGFAFGFPELEPALRHVLGR